MMQTCPGCKSVFFLGQPHECPGYSWGVKAEPSETNIEVIYIRLTRDMDDPEYWVGELKPGYCTQGKTVSETLRNLVEVAELAEAEGDI